MSECVFLHHAKKCDRCTILDALYCGNHKGEICAFYQSKEERARRDMVYGSFKKAKEEYALRKRNRGIFKDGKLDKQ